MNPSDTNPVTNPRGKNSAAPTGSFQAALDCLRNDDGRTLREITDDRPTLLVLLRHAGCTFCRQTIGELARVQQSIEARGMGIAIAGMSDSTEPLRQLGTQYGLTGVDWIADPDRLAYRALDIGRGSFLQLFGPRVIWAGIRGLIQGHGAGRIQGDPFQMPGTALIHRGAVLRAYRHKTAADHPDFNDFACAIDAPAC